jgi:Kef-type K+ transport system membrane component KefB
MSAFAFATIITGLILIASMFSVEFGLSAAIIEILFGVFAGNVLHMQPTAWLTFIASFAGILLTFLAGTEVSPDTLREKFKESVLIGGLSFLIPGLLAFFLARYGLHWTMNASKIAGIALSTTSLAVVYAVLVESGLTKTELGKIIMAACFITDFCTAAALSLVFLQFNFYTLVFFAFSALLLIFGPRLIRLFFNRYGGKVIEPEIKLLFFLLFVASFLGEIGDSQAVLPAFVLGLLMSNYFAKNPQFVRKLRTVGFAFITPFFFIKGGMSVNLGDVVANWVITLGLLAAKIFAKVVGVYPTARALLPRGGRVFLTLLMSTGLTFGTIASTFGLEKGYITKSQFSILIAVVILSAVVPTVIAQRFWAPALPNDKEEMLAGGEEG